MGPVQFLNVEETTNEVEAQLVEAQFYQVLLSGPTCASARPNTTPAAPRASYAHAISERPHAQALHVLPFHAERVGFESCISCPLQRPLYTSRQPRLSQ